MRIAHIESSMNWGGQELRIVEQTHWLNQHGHPTWIIARPGSKILEQTKAQGLPYYELTLHGSAHPSTFFPLLKFLKKEQINLLDCHGGRDGYYGTYIKWFSKIAVVRSRHITNPVKHDWLRRFIWNNGNHAIIVTAQKISEMLLSQKLAKASRIVVAPAGVDTQRFHPNINAQTLKQTLNIPPEHTVIANIGMIRPDKGQRYFIEAAQTLLAQRQPMTFIQVGEATAQTQDYYREIINLAGEELGKGIRLIGYHADIENYIALSDIVVIASIATEAQTRLVGQASLMKRNLIATTIGGLPEMIKNEVTGLLCEPGSSQALQDAITRLTSDLSLASRLREAAYRHAQETMSFEHMMDVMLHVYQKAIRRATGHRIR